MPKGDGDNYNAVSFGLYMGVGVVLGLLIGTWLGRKFGWGPWGPVGGSLLGLASGMYLLIKEGIRINKD